MRAALRGGAAGRAAAEDIRVDEQFLSGLHFSPADPSHARTIGCGRPRHLATEEAGKKVPHMVSTLCDGAADFLTFETPVSFHRVQDTYARGDQQALMWRTSGTAPFRVVTGDADGSSFYACVSEETAREFEGSLREKHAQESLRSWLREPRPVRPAEPPKALKLLAPRELFLGNLYLPPRTACGSEVLETLCTALSAESAARPDGEAPGVWAASECMLADPIEPKRLAHWYFFSCPDAATAARTRETYKEIAGCLFRGALPALGEALGGRLEKPALGLDVRPDLGGRTRYLLLSARMRLASVRMPVAVYIDAASIGPLLRKHCDPEGTCRNGEGRCLGTPSRARAERADPRQEISHFSRPFPRPAAGAGLFPFQRLFRPGHRARPFPRAAELPSARAGRKTAALPVFLVRAGREPAGPDFPGSGTRHDASSPRTFSTRKNSSGT